MSYVTDLFFGMGGDELCDRLFFGMGGDELCDRLFFGMGGDELCDRPFFRDGVTSYVTAFFGDGEFCDISDQLTQILTYARTD